VCYSVLKYVTVCSSAFFSLDGTVDCCRVVQCFECLLSVVTVRYSEYAALNLFLNNREVAERKQEREREGGRERKRKRKRERERGREGEEREEERGWEKHDTDCFY